MNLLAIDTSTNHLTVALSVNGVLYSEEQSCLRQHALSLLPMIERLLISATISQSQLEGIVFGCGPGSFTGLRIACSVAKGLAYAHDLPLFPVSSLLSIASAVEVDATFGILAMIDARMGEVYWAYYPPGDLTHAPEWVTKASNIVLPKEVPIAIAGCDLGDFITQMPHAVQMKIKKTSIIFPNAAAMIRLVEKNIIQPKTPVDAMPKYVRNQVTEGACRG